MQTLDYPFEMRPLTEEEGGGWLITFPDFPGCMGDGETIEEAIADGKSALESIIAIYQEDGRQLPEPGESQSGKFVQRLPKSLHARLTARARQEGVSMNTLVVAFIAEGLGKREALSQDRGKSNEK
jgi:antitoxin HicB